VAGTAEAQRDEQRGGRGDEEQRAEDVDATAAVGSAIGDVATHQLERHDRYGTTTKKTQRHPRVSVITPPITGPITDETPKTPLVMPW
jgi:hypothetical protein